MTKCKACGGTGFAALDLGPIYAKGDWDGVERRQGERRRSPRRNATDRRKFREVVVPLYRSCPACDGTGRETKKVLF